MGIVSFITLVSVLLLAVLSVLCIVTANASRATAQRQASSIADLYTADSAGQRCLAAIDGYLAESKQVGESAQAAVKRVAADLDGTLAQAMAPDGDTASEGLTYSLAGDGRTLDLVITHQDGRVLQAALSVDDDLDCVIDAWKTSTTQASSSDALWSSSGTDDANADASQGSGN